MLLLLLLLHCRPLLLAGQRWQLFQWRACWLGSEHCVTGEGLDVGRAHMLRSQGSAVVVSVLLLSCAFCPLNSSNQAATVPAAAAAAVHLQVCKQRCRLDCAL